MAFKDSTFKPTFGDKVTDKTASKVKSAVDIVRGFLDSGDADAAVKKLVRLLSTSAAVATEVAEHFVTYGVVGDTAKKKIPKLGGKKSSRLESMQKQAAKLARDIARETAVIERIEQRFVARVARDITMEELWALTNAKLGKPKDKSRAIAPGKYTIEQLATYKIIVG